MPRRSLVVLAALLSACGAAPGAAVPTITPEPTPVVMLVPTEVLEPTIAPEPTTAPEPTDGSAVNDSPLITEVPTDASGATDVPFVPEPKPYARPTFTPAADAPSAKHDYVKMARDGVRIATVRASLDQAGLWRADVTDAGNGPEVTLTMPVAGLSDKAKMIQVDEEQLAMAVKAIFDGDPAVASVTAIGTFPKHPNASEESPVVSIVVARAQYTHWDGATEHLGDWQIEEALP